MKAFLEVILTRVLIQVLVMKMVFKKRKTMDLEELGSVFSSLPASSSALLDLSILCPSRLAHETAGRKTCRATLFSDILTPLVIAHCCHLLT